MNPNRIFRQTAVVLSLIALAMILIAPSATQSAPEAPAAPAKVVDLTISLHRATKPTGAVLTRYEDIIKRLADALYEASNGAFKLGEVTLYLGGQCASTADVIWTPTCHPSGHISGYGTDGLSISFCDDFSGSMNYITDANGDQGGGYTLGHEMGHYFFSMYDEYQGVPAYDSTFYFPHSTDTPIANAIMNNQWAAVGGDFKWLNFSTAKSYTTSSATAQKRAYEADCWTTLVRAVSADPRNPPDQSTLPIRIYHPELAAVAPAAGADPAIDLVTGHTARSELDIVWGSCDVAYQIVIDKSGSMDDVAGKMEGAIAAAKVLVQLAPEDHAYIGVVEFNQNINVVHTLSKITSQADKDAIKTKIDNITVGGYTDLGGGLKKGLDEIQAAGIMKQYKVTTFALSDGRDNVGITPASVIPQYVAAKIPIYAFGYGPAHDVTGMQNLATGTGGKYYNSPTTMADITNAFNDAFQATSPSVGVSGGSMEAEPAPILLGPDAVDFMDYVSFQIDPTVSRFDVTVVYPGALGDFEFSITSPSLYDTLTLMCDEPTTETAVETLCYVGVNRIPKPGEGDQIVPFDGNWDLNYTNKSGEDKTFQWNISALAQEFTPALSVSAIPYGANSNSSSPSDLIPLPQPVIIEAVVGKEIPIRGALVIAKITMPGDPKFYEELTMLDDGVAPDTNKDDGIYAVKFIPGGTGPYNVLVEVYGQAGVAWMTKASYQPSHPVGGGDPGPDPNEQPIGYDFERYMRIQINNQLLGEIFLPLVER
jgi:hypothetical protein